MGEFGRIIGRSFVKINVSAKVRQEVPTEGGRKRYQTPMYWYHGPEKS